MTILQNAYKGYLEKKYEKEINEFKETTIRNIKSEIKSIERKLLNQAWDTGEFSENEIKLYKDHVSELNKVLNVVSINLLSLELKKLDNLGLWSVAIKYNALNDVIVKGESNTVTEDKYDWDELKVVGSVENTLNHYWDECKNTIKGVNVSNTVQLPTEINLTINIDKLDGNNYDVNKFAEKIKESLKNIGR